ncbi:MAG: hypothetical protein C0501_11560 [Isosphaera sp.]|nr:hypothetical protein [Isosphaera sp.]
MPRPVRVALFSLLAAAAVVTGYFAYEHYRPKVDPPAGPPTPAPVAARPPAKLVVLVVFDQLHGDYLAKWAGHFGPDGFERLKREGVWYADAHVPYACTSTGPGHASLVTGAPPSAHGIVENEWWDRGPGVKGRVYCCQPTREFPLVPPPPKQDGPASRGTDLGFSPERLLAETVGDRLKAATGGKGRVVSLSLKDRTAVLMGGKRPDAVYCFDTRDGLFHTGAYYRDQAHPWAAEFNAGRPADRWFGQAWERVRPDLDYAKVTGNEDGAAGEGYGLNDQGRLFPHPFKGKLAAPGKGYYEALECSPAGNELLLDLAKRAVAGEKLGQGEAADLLCLSFSSVDLVGHLYGPDSWEVFDMVVRADRLVADLLASLDATVGKDRYAVVLSADHGVCPLPEQGRIPGARRVLLTDKAGEDEVFGRLAAKLDDAFGRHPSGPTRWFETADAREHDRVWPWVYLNHAALAARGLAPEEVAVVARDFLAGRAFVEAAFTRKDVESGAFEPGGVGAKVRLAYHPDRCGDVIVVPKRGVLVTRYPNGTTHGSPHDYDTHVPVLAAGPNIPALGRKAGMLSSLVVAPILAKALGVDPPKDAVEKAPW